jgi:selenide,water dikinase
MSVGQGTAAAILAPVARAMTDVTGFGLAGHLLEMLEASGVAARVRLDDVPLMAGAVELAAAGVGSSLQPANLATVSWRMTVPQDARVGLLTDPQTCGGLLASVPSDRVEALVAALRAAGHQAALIGEVVAGAPHLTVVQV